MKAFTIIITLLLSGIISSYAASAQKQKLDSVIYYFPDNGQWVNSGKDVFAYDANDNAIRQRSYGWDGLEWDVWEIRDVTYHSNGNTETITITRPDSLKNVSAYDSEGKFISRNYYTWDGSQWADDIKNEYTYDANGNNTLILQTRWNGSQWLNVYKVERTFDASGNITEQIDYLWYSTQWNNRNKEESTYDVDGNRTLYIEYNWSASQWVYSIKIESSYDVNGYRLMNLRYEWDGTQWVNSSKTEFTPDSLGNITLFVGCNWVDSAWACTSKTERTFDSNNNLIANKGYSWDGSAWVFTFQEVSDYDTTVSPADVIIPDWFAMSYYSNHGGAALTGKILEETLYNWDEVATDWDTMRKIIYFYSDVNTAITTVSIKADFSLYPNPASESVTIDFSALSETVNSVSVINALGERLSIHAPLSGGRLQLQTSMLSAGIYIVELETDRGVMQRKIVVR